MSGPSGSGVFRLALDTGATGTAIGSHLLTALGYDLKAATERVEVTTGSGVESVVRIAVSQLTALGLTQTSFPILALTIPARAGVDGVLGLDFVRHGVLTIDFPAGQLSLRA